ncbi:MAG TPA: hypothetical protein VHB47_03490 [Thermoanaerobaculia bacterium]|jgi:hypothetical protein|nr:hypothetical protein [Thermoanaerobaculia bacterium]
MTSAPHAGSPISDQVLEILREAKCLAHEYYRFTGRPLGITAEVAEVEAARLLGIQLSVVRQPGYDAVRPTPQGPVRLQIKSRCYPAGADSGQRLGGIDLRKEWDAVLMVLLGPDFEVREIWEADRSAIEAALVAKGSKARNDRGALPVSRFKRLGHCLWPHECVHMPAGKTR